jgi:hypothetical protein
MTRQPGLPKIDALSAERNSLLPKQLTLAPALRERSVGANHPMPWHVLVGRGQDLADETWGVRIDVAVGPDEPLRYRAYASDDELLARVVILRARGLCDHAGDPR